MVGYTDIQKEKPKEISFGWSYYTGWVAMATSLLIGLSSIMNEILPPIENSEYHNALTELWTACPYKEGLDERNM